MAYSVSYYLEKGFSPVYAAYFAAGRKKITAVKPNDDFSLFLTFDNGEIRRLDMTTELKQGTVFEPLMRLENFKRAYLDENSAVSWDIDPTVDSRIYWNNKIDLSPDACYVESHPV